MKITNAIKKLNKAGAMIVADERKVKAILNGYNIEAFKNTDGTISTPAIKRVGMESDPMTDYCAWTFYDNLTQAINSVTRYA